MKSLALRAHRKELELAWHVDADVPEAFLGDPARLRQVLVNLVGNAIKFTPSGEVVLNVGSDGGGDEQRDLKFEISDTGVGIPAEKMTQIFAEFEQADSSTTREFGGTGLGLSISSRLVDLMGGRIQVESELGRGSRFFFTIPLELAKSFVTPAVPSLEALNGLRVLIVDDNATNRRIQKETIESWSMQV
jgi:signal transduction histidine kinase